VIYVNNAGTTWPKPDAVPEAVAGALDAEPADAADRFRAAHERIARFLDVREPERLLLTPSCTGALAVALADLPWKQDDVVVTSALEHHALAGPVERLVRDRGVTHRPIPYRPGTPLDLDLLRDVLRGGGVRLVAVTAASNVTGELLPVQAIVDLAHEHGALCLVDAAQTVGLLPVNAAAMRPDILTFAGHKGPLGPPGIGGLWAAPGVRFESPRAVCDITAGAACAPFPTYCDVGSTNLPAAAGLAAGMSWLEGPGREAPGRARKLARRLAMALGERPGVVLFGGLEAGRTATVSFRIDSLPVQEAEAFFRERSILLRAAAHCAPMALEAIGSPGGTIRVSFGVFNRGGDVDAVLAAVDEAIPAGR
jgi:selenocysteine lyase/cysteine desulfurase